LLSTDTFDNKAARLKVKTFSALHQQFGTRYAAFEKESAALQAKAPAKNRGRIHRSNCTAEVLLFSHVFYPLP
jgi:hypothetical protein